MLAMKESSRFSLEVWDNNEQTRLASDMKPVSLDLNIDPGVSMVELWLIRQEQKYLLIEVVDDLDGSNHHSWAAYELPESMQLKVEA